MSDLLTEKTRVAIQSLGVKSDSKLLVAVSGGPDSLALAHILKSLLATSVFTELCVAHVNHGIRPEAVAEEEVVRHYCKEWNISLQVKQANTLHEAETMKTGIEETARKQRYEFFEELSAAHGFDFILTAHTANDQAETVLLHMVRGAGVRGLAGIPPKRKLGAAYLLRPWLDVARNEIVEYLAVHDLHPVHDASNEELSYQRNRIRHIVIPAMQNAWPDRSPIHSIAAMAERMRELSIFLDQITSQTLTTIRTDHGLFLEEVKKLHGVQLHDVFEVWLSQYVGRFTLSSQETERVEQWLRSSSQRLELHDGVHVRKRGSILEVEQQSERLAFNPQSLHPDEVLSTPYGFFRLEAKEGRAVSRNAWVAQFDREAFAQSVGIVVRPWRPSDRIAPFGMKGNSKLVSDLLTEAHITGELKKNYPVVEWNEKIIWLPGIRRSDFAIIKDDTRFILELSFQPI